MTYIPKNAHWYLADVVLEHRIEGDSRNVVHINLHLIKARSPEQAFEKALAVGQQSEVEYRNTEGKQVQVVFRGLRQLNVIHEPLGDGAELTFEESFGVPEKRLQRWITQKEKLHIFAPDTPRRRAPNYMPESIFRMLTETLNQEGSETNT